ncbi:Mobilization protein A [Paenibacillus sp. P1XP2]|nr:Mobilization protein A [Paenibacillus sp. P1XP2]
MAIYHLSVQTISRGQGRSAVAAAAYRSGEKLHDERIGEDFDYQRKQRIDHTEIMAPEHAPNWTRDRKKLWNEVEKAESRSNSRTAREINVALPKELNFEQQKELVRDYVKSNFVEKGMVADVAIHDSKGENPHAHIMLTTREITPEGFGKKNRDWDKKESLEQWREQWEKYANRALEKAGSKARIDHRSLQEQGADRLPQIHVGARSTNMQRKGITTRRAQRNQNIIDFNEAKERIFKMRAKLEQEYRVDQGDRGTLSDRISEARKEKALQDEARRTISQAENKPALENVASLYEKAKANYQAAHQTYSQRTEAIQKTNSALLRKADELKEFDHLQKQKAALQEEIQRYGINPFKLKAKKEAHKKLETLNKRQETRFPAITRDMIQREKAQLESKLAEQKKTQEQAKQEFEAARTQYRQQETLYKAMAPRRGSGQSNERGKIEVHDKIERSRDWGRDR